MSGLNLFQPCSSQDVEILRFVFIYNFLNQQLIMKRWAYFAFKGTSWIKFQLTDLINQLFEIFEICQLDLQIQKQQLDNSQGSILVSLFYFQFRYRPQINQIQSHFLITLIPLYLFIYLFIFLFSAFNHTNIHPFNEFHSLLNLKEIEIAFFFAQAQKKYRVILDNIHDQ
ncbi:hypothetical protein ABPG74_014042 [Tetrahymena malaccensis]